MRFALLLLAAATLCAGAAAATPPSLVGKVTVATFEPQCSPKGCDTPASTATLRFRRGAAIRTVTATEGKSFSLRLAPGTYRVSAPGDAMTAVSPASIKIVKGKTLRVTFVLRLAAA